MEKNYHKEYKKFDVRVNAFDINGNCFAIFNKDESRLFILEGDSTTITDKKDYNTVVIASSYEIKSLLTIYLETWEVESKKLQKHISVPLSEVTLVENNIPVDNPIVKNYVSMLLLSENESFLYLLTKHMIHAFSTYGFDHITDLITNEDSELNPTSVMGVIENSHICAYYLYAKEKKLCRYKKHLNSSYELKRYVCGMIDIFKNSDSEQSKEQNLRSLIEIVVISKLDEDLITFMLIALVKLDWFSGFKLLVKKVRVKTLIIRHRLLFVFFFMKVEKDFWEHLKEQLILESTNLIFDKTYMIAISDFFNKFTRKLYEEEGYDVKTMDRIKNFRIFCCRGKCCRKCRTSGNKGLDQQGILNTALSSDITREIIRILFFYKTNLTFVRHMEKPNQSLYKITEFPANDKDLKRVVQKAIDECSVKYNPTKAIDLDAYLTIPFFDHDYGSEESRYFFNMICKLTDDDLIVWYKPLFYARFDSGWLWILIQCISIDWLNTILFYLVVEKGYGKSIKAKKVLCSLCFVTCSFKLIYEFVCILSTLGQTVYWTILSNYVDITSQSMAFLSLVLVITSKDDEIFNSMYFQYLKLITLVLLTARSITWFRFFKPTRHLVTMILVVFKEMFFYILFLTIFVFTYAFSWKTASFIAYLRGYDAGDPKMSVYSAFLVATNIVFGNSVNLMDFDMRLTWVQLAVHILGNIIIGLAFLNFLIAIISEVHNSIHSNQNIHEIKGIITLIKDFDLYYYGFKSPDKAKCCSKSSTKKDNSDADRFIIFIPAKEATQLTDMTKEVLDFVQHMKAKEQDSEKRIPELENLMNIEFARNRESVDRVKSGMKMNEDEIKKIPSAIEKIVTNNLLEKIEKNMERLQKSLQDQKEEMENFTKEITDDIKEIKEDINQTNQNLREGLLKISEEIREVRNEVEVSKKNINSYEQRLKALEENPKNDIRREKSNFY
jgi:hypothetical protein